MANHRRPKVKSTFKRRRRATARKNIQKRWNKTLPPSSPSQGLPSVEPTEVSGSRVTLPPSSPSQGFPSVEPTEVSGSRVIDISCLSTGIENVSKHNTTCKGKCSIFREVRRDGLASTLEVACDRCTTRIYIESSPKIAGSSEIKPRHSVNVGAVWGQLAVGGGQKSLNELLSTIGVPCMTKGTFQRIANQIGQSWEIILDEEILKAGAEEKQLALQRNDTFQGIPSITVVVDGGWAKRAHKHSYNAKSGMALIIGQETQKILYLGIRNKYCSICSVAANKGDTPKKHTCYKNWNGSSSAMETDIIISGFNVAEQMHGVRYMRVVGDGDSSVMTNIQQYVPIWGPMVSKVECANHSIKCYRNRLEKIVQDFPKYKGKGNLTQRAIKRLAVGARCAIKMHSETGNIEKLRSDLRNGPNHVFNNHSQCNPYFCKVAASVGNIDHPTSPGEQNMEVYIHNVEEESRGGDSSLNTHIEQDLFFRVQRAGDRLVSLAPQLISNSTSNIAECFMNIRCKFDGGKFYNQIQRGSFQHRTYGAGLRFQLGPDWSSKIWKQATGSKPTDIAKKFGTTEICKHEHDKKRKSGLKYKEQRKKSK